MKLNDVDWNKLRTFVTVADNGSVTAAAAVLGRTPSAVSQSLTGLERSLEARLFHRVGKRLVPTVAGERLWRGVRDHQEALLATVRDIAAGDEVPRGPVRVGLFLGFPRTRLSSLIAGFSKRFPDVSTRLVFAPESDLDRRLLNNRLDFTISFRPSGDAMPHIASTQLFEQELVLVTGKEFLPDPFDPSELARVPIVDYYQSAPLIERWLRHHVPRRRIDPRVAVWAATTDLVVELVMKNTGVGVVPRYLVDPYVSRGRLRIVRSGRAELADSIWLNELADSQHAAAGRAFRAATIAALADLATDEHR